MEPVLKILLLLLIRIQCCHQERFQCHQEPNVKVQWHHEGSCVQENSDQHSFLELDSDSLLNYTVLELVNATFAQFGSNHFQVIPASVTTLSVYFGNVSEVYFLSGSLHSLSILDTDLHRFFVAEQENQALTSLEIRSKALGTVPFSIEYLKELQKLTLRGCNLTMVDVKQFGGLSNLVELDLAENSIFTLDIPVNIRVGSLRKLFIEDNFLTEVKNFPMAFPRLRTLGLYNNRWYCDWVAEVRKRIMTAWIVVYGRDVDCEKRIYHGGLCCVRRPDRVSK
ncbi:uncharacterized protein LOC135705231 [Ochlerotatus camptorhynchus]|uniref:uncharacterized protein LOC135705231 n=1 Tax=Ochlerotatus camptorhynchus TaxID=644619 RepID=UPI0031DC9D9E